MTEAITTLYRQSGSPVSLKIAEEALDDMISWLATDQGDIGVFDATNTTRERRLWIMEKCKARHLDVLFVESICNDPKVIEENVLEVKVNSPDYVGMDKDEALMDFMKRMQHYGAQYVPIDDDLDKDWSYIKIFNQGQRYLFFETTCFRLIYLLIRNTIFPFTVFTCDDNKFIESSNFTVIFFHSYKLVKVPKLEHVVRNQIKRFKLLSSSCFSPVLLIQMLTSHVFLGFLVFYYTHLCDAQQTKWKNKVVKACFSVIETSNISSGTWSGGSHRAPLGVFLNWTTA
ncbi:unnamed protein product [Echinostoma caproni]|uniref:6PF2K domain-containing protein n=1 Tax=Echinostoma caproni TaxID=27848 RepID=A0A183A948_9TREM|nr:unnamed protein product [Echinostoma caproni]